MIIENTIDFHNLGIITPEQISFYLDKFLEESYVEKFHTVLVITGKGNPQAFLGKILLRDTVRQCLKKHKLVKSFHVADSWNGGAGAFEVSLKD